MNTPKIFYSQAIVKKVAKIIDPKGSWYGMTIPEGVPEAVAKLIDKVPPQFPKVKAALQLLKTIKAGIYFTDAKPKVTKKQFKHECYHWERSQEMGGVPYFELLGWQYLTAGHDGSKEEKAANKYGNSGALTVFEQNALDASV
jgi:hypothetical protein